MGSQKLSKTCHSTSAPSGHKHPGHQPSAATQPGQPSHPSQPTHQPTSFSSQCRGSCYDAVAHATTGFLLRCSIHSRFAFLLPHDPFRCHPLGADFLFFPSLAFRSLSHAAVMRWSELGRLWQATQRSHPAWPAQPPQPPQSANPPAHFISYSVLPHDPFPCHRDEMV